MVSNRVRVGSQFEIHLVLENRPFLAIVTKACVVEPEIGHRQIRCVDSLPDKKTTS